MKQQYMEQLNIHSIPATSAKSTVKVHAKPESVTAAKSTIHNSFIHNGQTFCKFPANFLYKSTGLIYLDELQNKCC